MITSLRRHRLPRLVATAAPVAVVAVLVAGPGAAAPALGPEPDPEAILTVDQLPPTLTRAQYVLSNGVDGVVDLGAADATPDSPARVAGEGPIVVSLGDSYISGEAGRWAGNAQFVSTADTADAGGPHAYDDLGTAEAIPGCHRSSAAEIHFPAPAESQMAQVNLACSGATTGSAPADLGTEDDGYWFKPGIDFADWTLDGQRALGQAQLLQNLATSNPGRVRMVVLSIGGNDFNFGPIVGSCVAHFLYDPGKCSTDKTVLANFTDANIDLVRAQVAGAMANVVTAMAQAGYASDQWSLLVQTYPSPVAGSETVRYWQNYVGRVLNGGCPLYDDDLDWANNYALQTINGTVVNAAIDARRGAPAGTTIKVMDLSDALIGHRLCEKGVSIVGPGYFGGATIKNWRVPGASDGSEWSAQIRLGTQLKPQEYLPFMLQESIHPNYWGERAISSCVQQAWNGGSLLGGTCQFRQTGLDDAGRPRMSLRQLPQYDDPAQEVAVVGTDNPQYGKRLYVAGAFDAEEPMVVRDLRADARRDRSAAITWKAPQGVDVAAYRYRLRKGDDRWGDWSTAGRDRQVTVTGLKAGASYTAQVLPVTYTDEGEPRATTFRVPG